MRSVTLNAGYEADVVTGATMSLYAVDAVSSATTFDDVRHSGRGGLSFRGRRSALDVGYTYGTERDYRSHIVTVTGAVDLPGKNTTFALAYAHNFDTVCDRDNGDATPLERRALGGGLQEKCFSDDPEVTTHAIAIDTAQASVTQNVSPVLVVQFGVHGSVINGFQSNPYRRVRVAGVDAQEQLPLVRARGALFARANLAFPPVRSALGVMVRGYSDTWGVVSGAAELTYSQYMGGSLLLRVRSRVYQQTGATFFLDAAFLETGAPNGTYWTGDRELAPLRTVLVGGKLSYVATAQDGKSLLGLFDALDFHLKADAIWAESMTEHAPGLDPAGPMPDAFSLAVGLQLRY